MTDRRQVVEVEEGNGAYPSSDARRKATIVSLLGYGLTALVMAIDVAADIAADSTPAHVGIEIFLFVFSLGGVGWFGAQWRRERAVSMATRQALVRAQDESLQWQQEAQRWRGEAREALEGLGQAIDVQFERWSLTPAERDVALMLLKGLAHKEIAAAYGKSERTTRQQARAVYKKAELAGRAELSAFFLEDLLAPRRELSAGQDGADTELAASGV